MTPRRAAALGLAALTMTGCAERRLVTAPGTRPTTATWILVWLAGITAALVLGVLLTLPAWRDRRGARVAVALLTIQAGGVVVSGTVLGAVAIRSWQLIERPPDNPATALLRLSRVDGDTGFFALVLLLLIVGAGLLATITAICARFAAGPDPLERWVACSLLAVQLGGSAFALVHLVTGAHGWPYVSGSLAFPLIGIALATCWPPRQPA